MANPDLFKTRRKRRAGNLPVLASYPAQLGDGAGNLFGDRPNYVYARVAGRVEQVFNVRVPSEDGLLVWVGRDASGVYQVLSTRTIAPGGPQAVTAGGYAPATRYQLFGDNGGGQDPLWVRPGQILGCKVYPSAAFVVTVTQGMVWVYSGLKYIDDQTVDLSALVPATSGNAVYVLVYVTTAGAVTTAAGSEFALSSVTTEAGAIGNFPARPADAAYLLAYVRLYNGQEAITESRISTDITDARFTGLAGMIAQRKFDYLDFDTAATTTMQEGRVRWSSDDGTLNVGLPGGNVVAQIGQELHVPRRVKNETGSDMLNGQIVYISGGDGTNAYISLAKADAEATSAYTLAMLTENIASGQKGYATTFGIVRDVDTSAYAPGTVLYLSPSTAGAYTGTKPVAPNHMVVVGTVFRQHASEGQVLVNIQNGYELDELHDVLITGLSTDDVLRYDGTTWANTPPASALGGYFVQKIGDTMSGGLIIDAASGAESLKVERSGVHDDVLLVNTSTGQVSINGLPSSVAPLTLRQKDDNTAASMALQSYAGAGTSAPAIVGQRGRGANLAAASAVQSGDVLLTFGGEGFATGAFTGINNAVVQFRADENFTSAAKGTRVQFEVTASGTTTRTEAARISNNGYMGINTAATPVATLQIHAKSASVVAVTARGAASQTAAVATDETSAGTIVNQRSVTAGVENVINEQGADIDTRIESDTEPAALWVDASADAVYIGGATNAVKIAKGGELTLIGTATRWDDLRIEPVARNTGTKAALFTSWKGGLYLYDFDDAVVALEKEIYFNIQMSHAWKEGSTIYPHVHWIPKTAGAAGNVIRWGFEYTKAAPGATFGASTTVYSTVAALGDITVADDHMITDLTGGAGINMTGDTLSTVLVCRLFRNSSNAADTYTGTAGLLYIDVHHEIDSMGSSQEYIK